MKSLIIFYVLCLFFAAVKPQCGALPSFTVTAQTMNFNDISCPNGNHLYVCGQAPGSLTTGVTNINTFSDCESNSCEDANGVDCDLGETYEDQIRWGDPAESSKSGFGFHSLGARTVCLGEQTTVGRVSHINYPIWSNTGANNWDAKLIISIAGVSGTFGYDMLDMTIDETPNSGTCAYTPEVSKCPDKISYTPTLQSTTFVQDGKEYTVSTPGFLDRETDTSAASDHFISQEGIPNNIKFVAVRIIRACPDSDECNGAPYVVCNGNTECCCECPDDLCVGQEPKVANSVCVCVCPPGQTAADCNAPKVFDSNDCSCTCPNSCGPGTIDTGDCSCTCPDCPGEGVPDPLDECECVCDITATDCPAPEKEDDSPGVCDCVCDTANLDSYCAANHAPKTDGQPSTCGCVCPSVTCPPADATHEDWTFSQTTCTCDCSLQASDCGDIASGKRTYDAEACDCGPCPPDWRPVDDDDSPYADCECALTNDDCDFPNTMNLETCLCECVDGADPGCECDLEDPNSNPTNCFYPDGCECIPCELFYGSPIPCCVEPVCTGTSKFVPEIDPCGCQDCEGTECCPNLIDNDSQCPPGADPSIPQVWIPGTCECRDCEGTECPCPPLGDDPYPGQECHPDVPCCDDDCTWSDPGDSCENPDEPCDKNVCNNDDPPTCVYDSEQCPPLTGTSGQCKTNDCVVAVNGVATCETNNSPDGSQCSILTDLCKYECINGVCTEKIPHVQCLQDNVPADPDYCSYYKNVCQPSTGECELELLYKDGECPGPDKYCENEPDLQCEDKKDCEYNARCGDDETDYLDACYQNFKCIEVEPGSGTVCTGEPVSCEEALKNVKDEDLPCVTPICLKSGKCDLEAVDDVSCDDGNPCTIDDICENKKCVGGGTPCDAEVPEYDEDGNELFAYCLETKCKVKDDSYECTLKARNVKKSCDKEEECYENFRCTTTGACVGDAIDDCVPSDELEEQQQQKQESDETAAIIGIVIGAALFLIAAVVAAIFLIKYCKNQGITDPDTWNVEEFTNVGNNPEFEAQNKGGENELFE